MQLLCKAVQVSLSQQKGEGVGACLAHCERSSAYLRASISVQLAQSATWLNKVRRVRASSLSHCSEHPHALMH